MLKLREQIQKFRGRLAYCSKIESEAKHANLKKIDVLRANLLEELKVFEAPVIIEAFGLPIKTGITLTFSLFFSMMSFLPSQFFLWITLYSWLQPTTEAFAIGLFIATLIFSSSNVGVILMIARGYTTAIKAHLMIVGLALFMSVVHFTTVLLDCVNGSVTKIEFIIAILSLIFVTFSIMIILSKSFYKMMLYTLRHRLFRKMNFLISVIVRSNKGMRKKWRESNK